MADLAHHLKMAKEKREAALDEYEKGRYTVVGDMVIKAVEQAIEAVASKEGIHFHLNPKTAHAGRIRWAKEKFPKIVADLELVWGTYGDLGYDGLNGNRAREAIEAMERIMDEIGSKAEVRFK